MVVLITCFYTKDQSLMKTPNMADLRVRRTTTMRRSETAAEPPRRNWSGSGSDTLFCIHD